MWGPLLCLGVASAPAQAVYSGGELRTREAPVYGRFEVRMRSAAGSGLVSSFFTYSDASYPTWNEIDLENLGRYTGEVQFNYITGQVGSEVNHPRRYATGFNAHADFHVYAFEWRPDSVVYYVDGRKAHRALTDVDKLKHPQKIMMNLWISDFLDWVGPFNRSILPVYSFYDYVSFSAYTPKAGPGGSDFTLRWKDDFNAWNDARWERASHGFEHNLAQFHPANVVVRDGLAILCLTEKGQEGFKGQIPAPTLPISVFRRPARPDGPRFLVNGRRMSDLGRAFAQFVRNPPETQGRPWTMDPAP